MYNKAVNELKQEGIEYIKREDIAVKICEMNNLQLISRSSLVINVESSYVTRMINENEINIWEKGSNDTLRVSEYTDRAYIIRSQLGIRNMSMSFDALRSIAMVTRYLGEGNVMCQLGREMVHELTRGYDILEERWSGTNGKSPSKSFKM